MVCEKFGGFHKSPVNMGRNGAFFQKSGFQKKDVKSTIDFNLSSEVWEDGGVNIKNSSCRETEADLQEPAFAQKLRRGALQMERSISKAEALG
ncbi:MAG: hypothetical protein JWR26_926 [Pedosphaera sp.]|nr:hypothetical protein [Pedosphaera sp.]